jgi:homodimeric pyruvate:ferredoxin (flavodoxin) oxidoreductase
MPRAFATQTTRVEVKKSKSQQVIVKKDLRGSLALPTLHSEGQSVRALDGNTAAAHVAYAFSDVSFIYPISPSTSMGETVDKYANGGRKNIFGQVVKVRQMQSENGSAGAVHGALSSGSICTTFTASQGLLLMIPNMYLLAGELLPAVFHVSARALARHALSIFCDHSDIMAVRTTGVAILGGSNVQEVMDLGVVSHLAALESSVPFVHWFDGGRTSGGIESVAPISYSTMKSLVNPEAIEKLRVRGLNPQHPHMRGLGQDPQVYYQSAVAANKYYDAVPDIVQAEMDKVAAVTGRKYKLFDYYGDPEADRVIVAMGSAASVCEEGIDHLRTQGEKVGLLKVRLFRPFSIRHFLAELPESVKSMVVLDRTKEDLASALPLHADVLAALNEGDLFKKVVGGNYGLGSKEFAPRHVKAALDNLKLENPKKNFTLGIEDDVTNSSLPVGPHINCVPETTTQAVFFGLGSDGTVGANKQAAEIIGGWTNNFAQGYFNYSSQKAGGSTVSHLRFGPEQIKSAYEVETEPGADYVACHHISFLGKFAMMTSYCKEGGIFVINCPWTSMEDLNDNLPARLRRGIAEKNVQLYTVDAHAVAVSVGLPAKRINQIMQGSFFHLSGVLPEDVAKTLLEESIVRLYGRKSPKIVSSNKAALAAAATSLNRINYPADWLTCEDNDKSERVMYPSKSEYSKDLDEFSDTYMKGITQRTAGELPVSAFLPGGETPVGQASFEKRGLAEEVPIWLPDTCTQCNLCSIVCPHAVVRPFLLDKKESGAVPEGYEFRKAKGGEFGGLNYTIQLAPFDCTGCAVCVEMCPDDSLKMEPQSVGITKNDHWEYSLNRVTVKDDLSDRNSVKGSQFQDPLMEFSGACSGCGETPYVKLLTQMFGERMVIANSSGCSSVWGGSYGISPFKKNRHGQGPAWARSLFEDTAEYGLGMQLGSEQRRARLVEDVNSLLNANASKQVASPELAALLEQWLQVEKDSDKCETLQMPIRNLLEKEATEDSDKLLQAVNSGSDLLVRPSHWIIGGDGWAYDIGFGGLDHILASGQNINVLVLDTEGYSNTGAQVSKSTPQGAAMKMAMGGRQQSKKDLGAIAMMHDGAYVASVSMAADPSQTVKAFREAEQFTGPSIVLSYATCVDWGHKMGDKAMVVQQRQVVDGGYWPLYRYNPDKRGTEHNPFELDARRIDHKALREQLEAENRFSSLMRAVPEHAKALQEGLTTTITRGHEDRRRRAMNDEDLLDYLKKTMGESVSGERVTVLYGSDTGTAEMVAKNHQFELKRRGMKVKCLAFDDVDIADLPDESKIIAFVATAGQGDMPKTALKFWDEMEKFLETAPENYMANTQFAVFGMGDSSYVFFNEAAAKIDTMFEKLGASRIQEMGQGDDQHAERYDTELEEWTPNVFDAIEAPPPPQELGSPSHSVEIIDSSSPLYKKAQEPLIPISHASKPIKLKKVLSTVPEGYERPIDHFEFDIEGSGLVYDQGDSLGLFPYSDKEQVDMALAALKMTGDEVLHLKNIDSNRSNALPEVITARKLLTEVLDIGGWPKRRFYEMLKMGTTDADEKAELELMCSKDGKPLLKANNEESYSYAELLAKYPHAVPSIGHLIDYLPDVKPRLYSIASSPRMRGEDQECHLCIIKNEWTATSGRNRIGLCTRWLSELNVDDGPMTLPGFVHASAVVMPNSHKVPMVMVGLGTGIAPMRCFIEERVMAARAGEECGEMALFFGARNRIEYSYEEEFNSYNEEGPLTHIFTALSREQKEKIYVTHRLAQNMPLIYDLIHEKDGNLYLCGPGGNVPPQVREAVIKSIEGGGHSREYAEKYVTDMQINGRYNVEAW